MIKRSLSIYCTVAVAGGLCGALAPWTAALSAQPQGLARHQAVVASISPSFRHRATTPATDMRDLQLSPSASIAKPAPKAAGAAGAIRVAEQKSHKPQHSHDPAKAAPSPPLDFNLPRAADALAAADNHYKTPPSPSSDEGKASQPPLDPSIPAATDTDSTSAGLFNSDSGLRGFMTQNWINPRFGFQSGLAIKQQRLRDDNSDLTDNIAIGMGVLLAF